MFLELTRKSSSSTHRRSACALKQAQQTCTFTATVPNASRALLLGPPSPVGSLRHFVDDKTWTNLCESREDCAKLVRSESAKSPRTWVLAKLAKLPQNLGKSIPTLRKAPKLASAK